MDEDQLLPFNAVGCGSGVFEDGNVLLKFQLDDGPALSIRMMPKLAGQVAELALELS
jgi:hypothetical protein